MFTKPDDIDDSRLLATVARRWHLPIEDITYAPLGFGSHHWIAAAGRRVSLMSPTDSSSPTASPARRTS